MTDSNRGVVTSVTDPSGQAITSEYDALRRLTKTATMLNSQEVKSENTYSTTTGYLTTVKHNTTTDASGDVTYNFTYDTLGRQKKVSVGSATLSTTYYNATYRTVERIAYGNGGAVKYIYDSYGRVTGIRYDGASSNRFTYGYNAQGQAGHVTDSARDVTVYTEYDLAGRPCRKTQLSGTAHAYTGELSYNAYELPNDFTEYTGTARTRYTTAFSYDDENRVKKLTYGSGSVEYTYDKLGRITKRAMKPASTAVNTTYTYLAGGQGTDSTTGMIQTITQGGVTLTYAYDDCGNISQVNTGSLITKYTYDAIGRLTRADDKTDTTAGSTGTTWVYTYDLGGNILTKKAYVYTTGSVSGLTPVQSHTYTYGNANWKDQLTKYDSAAITYDTIGNPLTDGTWTYTWEHGKQLAQMVKTGETISFEYNEDGLRTQKTATSTGTTEYTLHGKNIVHLTQGSHTLHFYYDGQGKPGIVVYDGTAYGYLYNLQGDVTALVNGSGTKVVEYIYDAWGSPISRTGTMANTLGKVQPFRYRGYVYDEETGLYYLRSRYYKPGWNRFISADALVKGNLYCYCQNSIINCSDTDGYETDIALFGGDELFKSTILPRILEFIDDPSLWGYNSNTIHKPQYRRDGSLKKAGDIACGHFMIKITRAGKQLSAPGRFREAVKQKIEHGALFDKNGNLLVELEVGMEVYKPSYKWEDGKRIKVENGHVGMLIRYDFGDGLEWAVVQSAYVENDPNHGPIITSFYKIDTEEDETEWGNYTGRRY